MERVRDFRNIAFLGRRSVEYRRRYEEVSASHDESHLANVAGLTQLVGKLYSFNDRELWLAYTAGWFHDLVRSATEDPSVNDEAASAREATRIIIDGNNREVFDITDDELQAITFAISNHGNHPQWLDDSHLRESTPDTLANKVHLALFVADKLEANGPYVIARRSSFVAGDRLRHEHGDWRHFGFLPDKDEAFVVALESIIRLTYINAETIYPDRLKPVVHPLYEVQREFVRGLLGALDLNIEDIASQLLDRKDTQGRSVAAVRKLKTPGDVTQIVKDIETKGGLYNKDIQAVEDGYKAAALETIAYFSSRYQASLATLIDQWMPFEPVAQQWLQGMKAYANGTWLKTKQQELTRNQL